MTWGELFDAAGEFDVDLEQIRETLETYREIDD